MLCVLSGNSLYTQCCLGALYSGEISPPWLCLAISKRKRAKKKCEWMDNIFSPWQEQTKWFRHGTVQTYVRCKRLTCRPFKSCQDLLSYVIYLFKTIYLIMPRIWMAQKNTTRSNRSSYNGQTIQEVFNFNLNQSRLKRHYMVKENRLCVWGVVVMLTNSTEQDCHFTNGRQLIQLQNDKIKASVRIVINH